MGPVSIFIIIFLCFIFFTKLNKYDTKSEPVNYLMRSLRHGDLMHIAANLLSFYNLSFIENVMGSKKFFVAIVFLWILSSMLLYGYHTIFPSRKVYTVGFSAVIFGLIVIYYSLLNKGMGFTLGSLAISILPQLVVPGISWEGHICGVIAGVIYCLLFPVKVPRRLADRSNLPQIKI